MGRKHRTFDKEIDEIQKFKREIQKLKRENNRLRKELSRIDIDRYEHLRDLVEQQGYEEGQLDHKSKRQKLIEQWQCHECKEGHLKLHIINRPDGVFYWRKCNLCIHRTKLKRYSDDVEGIRDDK